MSTINYIPTTISYSLQYDIRYVAHVVRNMLNLMADTDLVVDTNLYRIYCSEFNKDISNLKPTDITKTVIKSDNLLRQFVYDNIISRVVDFVNIIDDAVMSTRYDLVSQIPKQVKDSLDDVIVSNLVSDAADAIDPILRLKFTLLENERLQSEMVDDVNNILLDTDDLDKFITIIRNKLNEIRRMGSDKDRIAKDTTTKLKNVIDYVFTLYLLISYRSVLHSGCLRGTGPRQYNAALDEYQKHFWKLSHLHLSAAICIYPGMVLNIPVDKDKCSTTSDSYYFLQLAVLYDSYKARIYKELKREIKISQ